MANFISDKRLYLTRDGRVVEEGDPDAASLLVGKGGELSEADARKYGLSGMQEQQPMTREEANRAQYDAARARGAYEEMRALDHRLSTDKEMDAADAEDDAEAEAKRQPKAATKARSAPPEDKGA